MGCAISQAPADNSRYLRFSQEWDVACALFTHPRSKDYAHVVRAVSKRKALSYQHFELFSAADLDLLTAALEACDAAEVPAVIHISRHDEHRFPEVEAANVLNRVLGRHPEIQIIISHCGGENVKVALEFAKDCPRVLLDTSRLEETSRRGGFNGAADVLSEIGRSVPSRRLIYGSDAAWPGESSVHADRQTLARVFTAEEVNAICEKNAAVLLRNLGRARTLQ